MRQQKRLYRSIASHWLLVDCKNLLLLISHLLKKKQLLKNLKACTKITQQFAEGCVWRKKQKAIGFLWIFCHVWSHLFRRSRYHKVRASLWNFYQMAWRRIFKMRKLGFFSPLFPFIIAWIETTKLADEHISEDKLLRYPQWRIAPLEYHKPIQILPWNASVSSVSHQDGFWTVYSFRESPFTHLNPL